MALYRFGTFTTVATSTAQNLNLGFIPDVFRMKNLTLSVPAGVAGQVGGVADVYWDRVWGALAVPKTEIVTYTAGDPVYTSIDSGTLAATTGIIPFQTSDALLYVPNQAPYTDATRVPMGASKSLVITGISQAANASVTATHSFTSADIGVTVVTFHGNDGMTQINGLRGIVQSVTSTTSFTVNIDSTNFGAWAATANDNPLCTVITGAPANTLYSNVTLPTADANLGIIGLRLGTTIIGTEGHVWTYEAILQSSQTGP